ncbi:hypothetical protein [Oceanicoccus sp. KOV_DT_Chl]|uniref:hypothetical protein n=1 Tax=Oceanicoccus sp. KOV_DT_Chl TaxID=1904639 RepID=UPI000C7D21A8|nr:hypothetical protein [Oceanicoccus sp. KOV_DT_Chl]
MLYVIAQLDPFIYGASHLLTLYLAAGIAAIMSTIDSALLTLGSMITHEGIRPNKPHWSQAKLQTLGKILSWALMVPMVVAAIYLPSSIWSLLVFMLETMLQLVPAVIVGVWLPQLQGRAVFCGMVMGLVITLGLKLTANWSMPLGIHSGLWGVIVSLTIALVMSLKSVAGRSVKLTT